MSYLVKVATFKFERGVENVKFFDHSCGINLMYNLVLRKYHSLIRNSVTYKVVCQQTFGTREECFKLWKGTQLAEGKDAFLAIQAVLEPLMKKGVFLTTSLLEELMLPSPVNPDKIQVKLSEHHSDHPEWGKIISGLKEGKTANGTAVGTESTSSYPTSTQQQVQYGNGRILRDNGAEEVESEEDTNMFRKLEGFVLGIPSMMGYSSSEDTKQAEKVWKSLTEGRLDQDFPQDGDDAPTWLIDAIENGHENTAIHMILSRFSTSKRRASTGDTPLHVAVRKGNKKLVKLLLAYQADPSTANNVGETPISLSIRNDSIREILDDIQILRQEARGYYSKNNHPVAKQNSDDLFLLCLDGGGMKAVITCHILAAIQTRMQELDKDFVCMTKCFDFFAGTSAGAILASLLIYNTITSVWNSGMYLYKFMHEVFMHSTLDERQKKLKQFITGVVGEKTVLSDLQEDRNMIVTATIANVSPFKLQLMTNYNKEGRRPVWEALLASSAAPTYFPPFENKYIDGGLMANNPTLSAMAEASSRVEHRKIGLVLSVGTGHLEEKQKSDVSSVFVPGLNASTLKSLYKSSKGFIGLLDHFVEQSTRTDGEVVFQAEYWCRSLGAAYERLSPILKEDVASDMSSINELVDLLYDTETYILKEYYKIDRIARLLVQK